MFKLNEKNIGQFNLISTLLILVIFAVSISFMSYKSKISDFEILKTEIKNKFIEDKKQEIKSRVESTNQLIKEHVKESYKVLKETIRYRVVNSYNIAYKIYKENKDIKSKDEIINIIKETLRPIRFNEGLGYIFMTSLDGKEILFPVARNIEGQNVLELQDKKGNFVIKEEIKIVKEKGKGYITDFWTKPNAKDKDMVYPKLTYIKGLRELNLYIGAGSYIDEANKQNKIYIQNLVTQLNKQKKDEYIIISELLDINGGDKFAKIIVHPTLKAGTVISDAKKDLSGKQYRKEYLKGLRTNGSICLNYSYYNPKTNKEMSKISYFVLNKEWNWIIATGFYDDILDEEINKWQEHLNELIKDNIYQHITLLIIFILILLVVIYVISNFTKKAFEKYKYNVKVKENELKEFNKNLQKKIKQEVKKNIDAQKQLSRSEKLAAMGEMIGNIAHQWRQPLSVITTAATGLEMRKDNNILCDEDITHTCDTINKNAQYLSKTIDDFKNFIKGERKKAQFKIEDTIHSFLNLVDGSYKNNNINIILSLQKDIVIDGYENELIQCFINIYNNAKDALIENNIENKMIFITTIEEEKSVIIKIKDNAGGIPESIISKVFEPYFTTKHKSKGTGLGLNMSYKLITQGMDGTIVVYNRTFTFEDNTYSGAEFIIQLPKK